MSYSNNINARYHQKARYYQTPNGFYCGATNSYCATLNKFIEKQTDHWIRRFGAIPNDAVPCTDDPSHPCTPENCRIMRLVRDSGHHM